MTTTPIIISQKKFKTTYPKSYIELEKRYGKHHINFNVIVSDFVFYMGLNVAVFPALSNQYELVGYTSEIRVRTDNRLKLKSDNIPYIEEPKRNKNGNKAEKDTTIFALNMIEERLAWI